MVHSYVLLRLRLLSASARTAPCCAIVRYEGDRQELLTFLSRFSYTSTEIAKLAPTHTGRALNREYQEKLVDEDRVRSLPCVLPFSLRRWPRLTRMYLAAVAVTW